MLIKPKEITITDADREEHTFIISRLPATIGREILAKYLYPMHLKLATMKSAKKPC